jgi:nitrogen-specific signal transduction histidine kinase
VRDVVGVFADCVIDAVAARHLARLVEEQRKRIRVLVDVLFGAEQSVDLLRRNHHQRGAAFHEFVVS